jgi:hypothetical protein
MSRRGAVKVHVATAELKRSAPIRLTAVGVVVAVVVKREVAAVARAGVEVVAAEDVGVVESNGQQDFKGHGPLAEEPCLGDR